MSRALMTTLHSLLTITENETALLRSGRREEVGELAAAKLKLTAQLERQVAELERERADWREALTAEEGEALASAVAALKSASAENAAVLQRQIDLSRELLDAIAAEAKRLGGTRSETYAASGGLRRVELPAPISINASL